MVLILWDIDKTLVHGGALSDDLWRLAFTHLTGLPVVKPYDPDGSTAALILEDLARLHGLPPPHEFTPAQVEHAYAASFETLRTRWRAEAEVAPGAGRALEDIATWRGAIQSVATGNVRSHAEYKLASLGLTRHLELDLGGYGSDEHRTRADLVALARARAAARGGPFDRTNTIVIGDTPGDVAAAHRGGARAIAVAAGGHAAPALAQARADVVVDSVAEVPDAARALLGDMLAGDR